jgi:hypothetical protein
MYLCLVAFIGTHFAYSVDSFRKFRRHRNRFGKTLQALQADSRVHSCRFQLTGIHEMCFYYEVKLSFLNVTYLFLFLKIFCRL